MRCQKGVGLAEVAATEKARVGRQWAGVRGGKQQVVRAGQSRHLLRDLTRVITPQHEHARLGLGCYGGEDRTSDGLPAELAVRSRLSVLDGQRSIEQQHTLPRPAREVAVAGGRDAAVVAQFLVDVRQRGRNAYTLR